MPVITAVQPQHCTAAFQAGAQIQYLKNDGYPPLKITAAGGLKGGVVKINGSVSRHAWAPPVSVERHVWDRLANRGTGVQPVYDGVPDGGADVQ